MTENGIREESDRQQMDLNWTETGWNTSFQYISTIYSLLSSPLCPLLQAAVIKLYKKCINWPSRFKHLQVSLLRKNMIIDALHTQHCFSYVFALNLQWLLSNQKPGKNQNGIKKWIMGHSFETPVLFVWNINWELNEMSRWFFISWGLYQGRDKVWKCAHNQKEKIDEHYE